MSNLVEVVMTLVEQIHKELRRLPPEKQREVLDFVNFLQHRLEQDKSSAKRPQMSHHPAFGSWRKRKIDALQYQEALRSEWNL
jgi:hypothetical protein